jgi:hypothetical protein
MLPAARLHDGPPLVLFADGAEIMRTGPAPDREPQRRNVASTWETLVVLFAMDRAAPDHGAAVPGRPPDTLVRAARVSTRDYSWVGKP